MLDGALPRLHWIDLAMLGWLLLSMLIGVWRGLLFELLSLAGLLVAWFGCQWAAPQALAAHSGLSPGMGAGRLSPLQPRPQRGARLHRDLCAGIPAERHGDHPAHELLLATGLAL